MIPESMKYAYKNKKVGEEIIVEIDLANIIGGAKIDDYSGLV